MANEAYDYPLLDMSLLNVDRISRQWSVIQASYGDGYSASALVGSAAGMAAFTLSTGVWPDNSSIKAIQNKAAFVYYYDFFSDRLRNGNAPFLIQWRNAYFLVQLIDPKIDLEALTADLFTTGIEVRGRRIPGVAVRQDASVIYPPEHSGLLGWWCADLFTDVYNQADGSVAGEWQARATAEILFPAGGETVKTNQINGEPVIRLTPSPSGYSLPKTFTLHEVAMVLKFREATFGGARTLLSYGFSGTELLAGASGQTKFTDLGIGGMIYFYNGTQLSATNMTAPMNSFGIVQVKFNSPISVSSPLIFGFRDISGGINYCPIDIAEILLFQSAVTQSYTNDLAAYLKAKYKIA